VGEAARRRQAMAVRHAALVILFAAPAPLSRAHETVNLFDVDKSAAGIEERAELVDPEPPAALFNLSDEITRAWLSGKPSAPPHAGFLAETLARARASAFVERLETESGLTAWRAPSSSTAPPRPRAQRLPEPA
jgi:hypothetical protein